jgi:hypothetical protein
MKKEEPIIKRLIKWAAQPKNTHAKLAVALGFESSNTVAQWFARRTVPKNRLEQVENFLRKEKF